nr:MAG TPA: YopX protein [Caudoviricetes sp.]
MINKLSAESYEVLDECSVIGNIIDNAKLLESEK